IVEDDREVRDAIAEVLADSEYKAVGASNGVEALEQLRSAAVRPCVILLDVMMPTMDAWAFRAEQERDPSVKDIPVVLLSAHTDVRLAAAQMNAAGFLPKPVAVDMLLETVEKFCVLDRASAGANASAKRSGGT
ncbi:MAG TPA: response regulator, partial [Myxococcales bacterium]|nr:response regulator [Myxococcales bacterium]